MSHKKFQYEYDNILRHYNDVIVKSELFDSIKIVRETELLFPDFYNRLIFCFNEYRKEYPVHNFCVTETFRSKRTEQKDKSIVKNYLSIHHFGLAADFVFLINEKQSMKGDMNFLRRIFKENKLFVKDTVSNHVQFIPVSEETEFFKIIGNGNKD
jgi:hypothetical protein